MSYRLTVCVPVYNGAKTIEHLVSNIFEKLSPLSVQIVLVNDASPDNSEAVCKKIAESVDHVKFISLRKNAGEHAAVMCALNHAEGDYVTIIDDDFQNPPQEILKLLKVAESGKDVVFSKYKDKKHHPLRNLGSQFNNLVATWLLDKPFNLYLSSFKLMSKDIVQEVIKYTGPFPYLDGLILRVTSNYDSVFVEHVARGEGQSNYTFRKLVRLWMNMFINFSVRPLRVITLVGFCAFFISILGISWVVFEKFTDPSRSVGWASLMCVLLAIFGLQSVFLGIIGEYIGKLYLDHTGTPQWVIKFQTQKR